jgi:5-methylcytosine-specific restriction endonuclease McrA
VIEDETQIEVDHVKAISAGGDPWDRSNWGLAHRICNRRKKAGSRPNPTAARRNKAPWTVGDLPPAA